MESSASGPGSSGLSRFGPFTLDSGRGELRRNGVVVPLRPKTYALLSYLVANPGRVAAKSELLAAVWPGVIVNDESLSQCVRELRGAMGADGAAFIKTVARRGYLFDAMVSAAGSDAASEQARRREWPRWMRASVSVAAVLALGVHWEDGRMGIDQSVKARRSIAILPLVDMGMPGAHDMAGAITEELVTYVAKLPDTQVIARPPGMATRGSDVRRIGRELGVRHVLTGSVRRDEAGVQVHVQLASPNGGTVLWSESFHEHGAADWSWKRAVGLRIARSLDVRMAEAARTSSPGMPGKAVDAVDATFQGQHLLRHVATYDDVVRARAYFELALATQPDSAAAWTGLAQSYVTEMDGGWSIGLTGLRLAEQALARARSISPDYLPARSVSARLLAARGDLEGALRVDRSVLAANPSDPWAHARIAAMLMRLGRPQEVVAHCDEALQLAPGESNLVAYSHLYAGYAEYYLGREDAAYERLRLSAAAGPSPTQFAAFLWLSGIDALHGRGEEARLYAAEVRRLRPRFSIGAWRVWTAPVHPPLQAARDRFFAGLAKTGLPE